MRFKVYNSIRFVKKYWEELIADDDYRVYQTYEMNVLYENYRKTSITAIRNRNNKCRYIVGLLGDKPVCIAPICIDESPIKTIHILGHGTNAGYLDFIYNDSKYVNEILEFVNGRYSDYEIDFVFVKRESPLVDALEIDEVFSNYSISLADYESWFRSLSKSTRQNIRTAYNRMLTDDHTYKLLKYSCKSKDINKILLDCNRVYQIRKLDWTNQNQDQRFIDERKSRIFLSRDIIYRGMRKMSIAELVVLQIDNSIAGFFIGFKSRTGVCIPRLAIDTNYHRYSPGMIMICEYLKTIISEDSFIFDLCRGDESYKTKLGGVCTNTFRLKKKREALDGEESTYSGTSGQSFRKHPDMKPGLSGHLAG